jgi:Histidine kinase/Y_Y_Y domain/Two component regulator propeller
MPVEINSALKRSIFLLIFLFSLSFELLSQKYSLKVFTSSEGLPHNNVREIIKDKSGYLWICTWDGLSRFDGYEFKNYHHIPGDSTSLPYFSIARIVLDGSNNFWIQTDNGTLARFNRRTDDFSPVTRINGELICKFPSICNDEKGNVWIINDTVIFRYDYALNSFTRFSVRFLPEIRALSVGYLYYLTMEDATTMWLSSNLTYKLELNEKDKVIKVRKIYKFQLKPLPPDKIIRNVDHITWYKLYIDKKGKKWLLSDLGLFVLNEESQKIVEFNGTLPVNDFAGNEFLAWGSLNGGFSIYRPGDRSIIKIPPETVQLVKYICPSEKDVIWFANTSFTGNSIGLSRLIITPDYFRKYTDIIRSDYLPAVFSITVDDKKNIWLGIRGRDYISVITPDNRLLKKYTEAFKMPGFYGPIRSIKKTPDGLWIGYFDKLLLFYNYKSDSFTRFDPGPYMYRALEVRKDGKLYIGNSEIILYDPVTGKKDILADSIPGGGNFRFKTGEDGTLWSGTPYGTVISYSPAEKKVRVFRTDNRTNNIEDVCPGEDGDIWLALLGGGLMKYNTVSGKSTVYTTSDGLSNNTVYSLLRDKKGNIWASTDNGISRLNPKTGTIRNFGSAEGLDIIEFNSGASFIDDNGRFYFGGMGGAVRFFPDGIDLQQADSSKKELILTQLTVSGKFKILKKTFNRSDTIILDKGEDNFHLTFATSDFGVSEKTIYRYRLDGHDRDWIVTDHNNRNINYDNLKPGLYKLEIEATSREGEWMIHKTVSIRFVPYFYQTYLFKSALTGIIILIIMAMIILYIRQLNQKAKQIQDELRLQALRGQMNPHFIFNSLNSINYFISNNDKISANRYIADFARLIRSILSNMGNDYVPFFGEMGSIKDYLEIEHLRFGDKFDYEIDISAIGNPEQLVVFPGLIQPFIENAIWHGVRALEKRKAVIRIKLAGAENQKIRCTVDDDGIGREMSHEIRKNNENHQSKGITIVRERLQIISKLRGINYSLKISDLYPDRKQTGTRIEIDIPCKDVGPDL